MIIDVSKITAPEAEPIDPLIADIDLGIVKAGPKGLQGDKGWTAVLAVETDGERRVQKVIGWAGGDGAAPPSGKYVGSSGLVDDIEDGVDIRGGTGATGRHVVGASVNGSYHLIFSYSDSTTEDAGYVRGQTGAAATVTINTVTTLPPGSPATVTNVGTSTDALLNFGIPKGDTGSISSVNGKTGASVTLNADDISDTSTAHKFTTAGDITKLAGIEALADVTDAANVGSSISGTSSKVTPVDADSIAIIDSAASNALKKVTWVNIKATLKTYFDTLYQPLAAKLTALAGQTWAADQITYQTSASAVSTTALTSFGRSLIDDADAATARSTLGLAIGTNVQAQSAKLTDIAGLSPASGDTIVWNGTNFVSQAGAMAVIKSVQSGYVSSTSLTTGAGEDLKYVDVTVSAVNTSKCIIFFDGAGGASADYQAYSDPQSASTSRIKYIVSKRMTSTTNLRLAVSSSNAAGIQGRWTIVEYN